MTDGVSPQPVVSGLWVESHFDQAVCGGRLKAQVFKHMKMFLLETLGLDRKENTK